MLAKVVSTRRVTLLTGTGFLHINRGLTSGSENVPNNRRNGGSKLYKVSTLLAVYQPVSFH